MLAVKNLERFMEIEADLKSQYQAELNSKSTEIQKGIDKQEALKKTIEEHKATIAGQLEQIKTLSASASDTKRIEQLNRELDARATKLQEETATQKKRIKAMQKDFAAEREELKELKLLDPKKLKKNQDASKKKLAEKTAANDALQKTANKYKKENDELRKKIEELEAKIPAEDSEDESKDEATATA